MPALDHLRVAGDYPDAGRLGGARDRLHLEAQFRRPQAFLQYERQSERERERPCDRKVVDGPVDGKLADRAAREADRLDHEAVGGDSQLADLAGIRELCDAERRREQAFDQRHGRLAAAAVCHRDLGVPEAERLGLHPLDQAEDVLLGAIFDGHQTTARSRAKRP